MLQLTMDKVLYSILHFKPNTSSTPRASECNPDMNDYGICTPVCTSSSAGFANFDTDTNWQGYSFICELEASQGSASSPRAEFTCSGCLDSGFPSSDGADPWNSFYPSAVRQVDEKSSCWNQSRILSFAMGVTKGGQDYAMVTRGLYKARQEKWSHARTVCISLPDHISTCTPNNDK